MYTIRKLRFSSLSDIRHFRNFVLGIIMRMNKPNFKKCKMCFLLINPFSSLCLLSHFRYLASGDSFKSIAFSYRMGKSTVTKIIPEVCEEIWRCLQPASCRYLTPMFGSLLPASLKHDGIFLTV